MCYLTIIPKKLSLLFIARQWNTVYVYVHVQITAHILNCSQDQNYTLRGVEVRLTLQGHPKSSATPWRIPTIKLNTRSLFKSSFKTCLNLDNCITFQPSWMVMMSLFPIVPNIPLFPFLLHWLWCPQDCFNFSHSSLQQLLHSTFHLFLNMFLQRHYQCGWWPLLSHVVGLFWSWLEPSGTGCVLSLAAPLASPRRGHLCSSLLPTPWHLHPMQNSWPYSIKKLKIDCLTF